jgi:hypothetical protein
VLTNFLVKHFFESDNNIHSLEYLRMKLIVRIVLGYGWFLQRPAFKTPKNVDFLFHAESGQQLDSSFLPMKQHGCRINGGTDFRLDSTSSKHFI